MRTYNRIAFAVALVLFPISWTGCATATSSGTAATPNSRLAKEMIGTWVHVGSPGNLLPAPAKGGRFKHRTGTHWTISHADPDSGLMDQVFGGTYTMSGNEYVETQHYSDQTWLHDHGKSWKFTVQIEGDIMTQTGIGNPFNEVWKRVR